MTEVPMNEVERAPGEAEGIGVAAGSIDEIRFVDTLVRNIDSDGTRAVPIGSRIVLRGWMFAPNPPRTPLHVIATFANRSFPLLSGRPRPDIATHFGAPQLADAGFHGIISLEGVPTGHAVLRVHGEFADGSRHAIDASVAFELLPSRFAFPGKRQASDGEMLMSIDSIESFSAKKHPENGALVVDAGDVVVIRGWAVDTKMESAPSGVFASIDGQEYFMGVHGLPRDDVAAVYSEYSGSRRSGFTVRIPTRNFIGSDHAVKVLAIASDGESYVAIEACRLSIRAATAGE